MTINLKLAGLISLTMLAACAPTGGGRSGSADCFTTDDGPYDCQVKTTDAAGSFVITAPGKPTYTMNISAPGIAHGFVELEGRNTPLPGKFSPVSGDARCWRNDETKTKICAR